MSALLTAAELIRALGTSAVAFATKLATSSIFVSTTQTATGSAQVIPHGLGAIPRLVWIQPLTFGVGAPVFGWTSDATNITATVEPAGSTYSVTAIL